LPFSVEEPDIAEGNPPRLNRERPRARRDLDREHGIAVAVGSARVSRPRLDELARMLDHRLEHLRDRRGPALERADLDPTARARRERAIAGLRTRMVLDAPADGDL